MFKHVQGFCYSDVVLASKYFKEMVVSELIKNSKTMSVNLFLSRGAVEIR